MSRPKRDLIPGYSYHITTRCNNREFQLTRHECRQVFLYTLKKALAKFQFQLYGGSRLSEIQEPHPQPPPRKRGGGL